FELASHFAVNVLRADQLDLSRRFAVSGIDKFVGMTCGAGLGGAPLLPDVLARFECRFWRRYDGGDHVILVGEVERYRQFGGEPLVYHSGNYSVAITAPDIPL